MDQQTQLAGQPRASSSSERHGNGVQCLSGAAGSSAIPAHRLRQGFDKDALRTGIVRTEEPPRPQPDHDRNTFPRQICNGTEITAVDPPRQCSATRTSYRWA